MRHRRDLDVGQGFVVAEHIPDVRPLHLLLQRLGKHLAGVLLEYVRLLALLRGADAALAARDRREVAAAVERRDRAVPYGMQMPVDPSGCLVRSSFASAYSFIRLFVETAIDFCSWFVVK